MASEGRKMYDVRVYNLECVECGKPIEAPPLQPLTSTRTVDWLVNPSAGRVR